MFLYRFGKQIPKQKKKGYSLVFSSGRVEPSDRRLFESVVSHIDVDSPSVYVTPSSPFSSGLIIIYREMPVRVRYARGLDVDTVATVDTGSFHSYVSPSSLAFQTSRALTYGVKCNFVYVKIRARYCLGIF